MTRQRAERRQHRGSIIKHTDHIMGINGHNMSFFERKSNGAANTVEIKGLPVW